METGAVRLGTWIAQPRSITRAIVVLLLCVVAWRSENFFSDVEPGPDSSMFMSMAWHATHGRALYKDVWEQKPPMIFLLDGVAIGLGKDGANSVRTMERLFAVVNALALFAVVLLAFRRFWVAALVSLVFVVQLVAWHLLESGNLSEEYGTAFLLIGVAATLVSTQRTGPRALWPAALAGFMCSLSILTKEPFVLLVSPWMVYLALPRDGGRAAALRRIAAAAAGGAVPLALFLGYLTAHGALRDYVATVAFSISYASSGREAPFVSTLAAKMIEKVRPFVVVWIAAGLGLIRLVRRPVDALHWTIAASAALGLFAASLGERFFGHYFVLFLPPLMLLCASGMSFAADLLDRRWRYAALAASAALCLFDAPRLAEFATSLMLPAKPWPGLRVSEVVKARTTPGDLIWAPWKPLVYVEAGRLSPTRWFALFVGTMVDAPGSSASEKLAEMRAQVTATPPRIIVISAPPGATKALAELTLTDAGLLDWIHANYVTIMCSDEGKNTVVERKSSPGQAQNTETAEDLMKDGLDALYHDDDPPHAVSCFRRVLELQPTHYGATFQLAKALDAAGQPAEAVVQWRTALQMATQYGDTLTMALARRRLAP